MIHVYVVSNEIKQLYLEAVPKEIANEDPMVIGALDDETKEACGVLCARLSGNEIEVLYVDVDESRRRSGIGSRMFDLLKLVATGMNADGISMNYVRHTDEEGSDTEALDKFMAKKSFTANDAGKLLKVPFKKVGAMLSPKMKPSPPAMIIKTSKATGRMWNTFRARIRDYGEVYEPENHASSDKSYFMDPGDMDLYDRDVSFLYIDKKGRPAGCILFVKKEDGVSLEYLLMLEDSMASKKALMGLFAQAFVSVIKKYGKDVMLYTNTMNRVSEAIFGKLAGGDEEEIGTVVEHSMRLN